MLCPAKDRCAGLIWVFMLLSILGSIHLQTVSGECGDVFQEEFEIIFDTPTNRIGYVVLEEDLTCGQRISGFQIIKEQEGFRDFPVYSGKTVGNRKICMLKKGSEGQNPLLFGEENTPLDRLVLRITSTRGKAVLKSVRVY